MTKTFKYILELVLMQGGAHGFLYGRDVLVEFDHQRVVVHALHVSHNGIIALLGQGDQVMETMDPDLQVQYKETTVSNVLEASRQVVQSLENLFSATFTLTKNLAVC